MKNKNNLMMLYNTYNTEVANAHIFFYSYQTSNTIKLNVHNDINTSFYKLQL